MTVSICRSCRYEQSDCKGIKYIEKTECDFFKEKLAINYPQRIRELEGLLEQADRSYDILLRENEALLLRADRLEQADADQIVKKLYCSLCSIPRCKKGCEYDDCTFFRSFTDYTEVLLADIRGDNND